MDSQGYNLLKKYFCSGWAFLLPYLAVYLTFWVLGLPVLLLTKIFYLFHGLHASGLIYLGSSRVRFIKYKDCLFWVMLSIFLYTIGANLEFPSDPWTHFRRIFEWQNIQFIEESTCEHKFAYFLGHSFLGWIEPTNRRFATDLYATVCLLLLAFQTYKLAKSLGLKESWARLSVLSSIFFLGYANIGFYAYHGISSSQISLLAAFAAIRLSIKLVKQPSTNATIILFGALALSGSNHIQGVLIWSMISFGILIASIISKFGWRKGVLGLVVLLALSAICCHPFISNFVEASSAQPDFEATKWILPWGGINPFGQEHLFHTLGLFGTINIVAGFFILRKNNMLGLITVAVPVLLILTPIGFALIYILVEANNTPIVFHRTLYGTLPIFAFLFFLQDKTLKYKLNDYVSAPLVGIFLTFFSIIQSPPIFGKALSILIRPTQIQELIPMDQTAQWLKVNVPIPQNQYFLSDAATEWAINSHLGLISSLRLDRRIPENLKKRLTKIGGVDGVFKDERIAGILCLSNQPNIDPGGSFCGKISGHWNPYTIQKNLSFDPSIENELQKLIARGWTKTQVPPWYSLYLRPK